NRAHRRLAAAGRYSLGPELDQRQSEIARSQIARMQNQLQRIEQKLLPEQEPHVEPNATQHHPGTEPAGCRQTRDCPAAGDLSCGSAQSPALELRGSSGTTPAREGR